MIRNVSITSLPTWCTCAIPHLALFSLLFSNNPSLRKSLVPVQGPISVIIDKELRFYTSEWVLYPFEISFAGSPLYLQLWRSLSLSLLHTTLLSPLLIMGLNIHFGQGRTVEKSLALVKFHWNWHWISVSFFPSGLCIIIKQEVWFHYLKLKQFSISMR